MTTTNLLAAFEEKTLFLDLSRLRDKGCSKPSFLLPDSAVQLIKFLGIPQVEPLRGGFETFSQHLKVPSGHSHTQAGLSSQQDTGPGCCKIYFFFCFCWLSTGEKSHSLARSLQFSPTVCPFYFFTLFVQHTGIKILVGGFGHWSFLNFLRNASLNKLQKKNDCLKKPITTFKFGKCFKFLNAALCFPA